MQGMAEPLLLALDQGTSSSRAVIFDGSGQALASAQVPLPIEYPADGWVNRTRLRFGAASSKPCSSWRIN